MKVTPTPTSDATDLPEALRLADAISNLLCSNEVAARTVAAAADELVRLHALAAGQATAAQAVVPAAQQPHRSGCTAGTDEECVQRGCGTNCPAVSPRQGVAYAALPDDGEPWHGHRFKEVQHGCWKCDCGKTLKEVTADQAAPATGDKYPLMPRRYTVDDDGEDLFTAEKMRAFADATHALRASHGQAPAQPDQPIACSYGDNGYACCEGGPCQADVHNDKLAEQQAPATAQADSVLEDAARYRYLRDGDWREHEKLESVIRLQLNALWDETIDAARKQGEKQ